MDELIKENQFALRRKIKKKKRERDSPMIGKRPKKFSLIAVEGNIKITRVSTDSYKLAFHLI